MAIGLRVKLHIDRPPQEVIDMFRDLPASTISDAMNRHGALDYRIKPLTRPSPKLVGPAFTVRTRAGDNLLVHKAFDMAALGDVIVIEAGGDTSCAIFGEIMCRIAEKRGVAGIIIDGLIRDSDDLAQMAMPVYCIGQSPLGPWKDGPGEVGFGIVCGGVAIRPGDIIVGDGDGVVVVPKHNAREIAEATARLCAREKDTLSQIQAGTIDRSWVDNTLKARGCEFIE